MPSRFSRSRLVATWHGLRVVGLASRQCQPLARQHRASARQRGSRKDSRQRSQRGGKAYTGPTLPLARRMEGSELGHRSLHARIARRSGGRRAPYVCTLCGHWPTTASVQSGPGGGARGRSDGRARTRRHRPHSRSGPCGDAVNDGLPAPLLTDVRTPATASQPAAGGYTARCATRPHGAAAPLFV